MAPPTESFLWEFLKEGTHGENKDTGKRQRSSQFKKTLVNFIKDEDPWTMSITKI